jgi:cell division protein FtsB
LERRNVMADSIFKLLMLSETFQLLFVFGVVSLITSAVIKEIKKQKQKEDRRKLSQMQKKLNDLSDDNWRLERKIDELNKKR